MMHGMSDAEAVKGVSFDRALFGRVWRFARVYRPQLAGFLVTIVIEAIEGLIPLLLVKKLIDEAIPNQDGALVTQLGLIMIGIAVLDAGLSLLERWWSSRIGEGLIFDLRSHGPLFDHTQRMPIRKFLHPHADRRPDQPPEQRRRRRAASAHRGRWARWSRTSSPFSSPSSRWPTSSGS